MEERFERCVKKYEGCMKQLKKAEYLLNNILKLVSEDIGEHFDPNKEIGVIVLKYFRESNYNEIANERSSDENTRIQPKSTGNS